MKSVYISAIIWMTYNTMKAVWRIKICVNRSSNIEFISKLCLWFIYLVMLSSWFKILLFSIKKIGFWINSYVMLINAFHVGRYFPKNNSQNNFYCTLYWKLTWSRALFEVNPKNQVSYTSQEYSLERLGRAKRKFYE